LIDFSHRHSESFDEETAIQALFALDNCLAIDDGGSLSVATITALKQWDLIPFLYRMDTPLIACRIDTVKRNIERVLHVSGQ
jgi:hypothetical protein